MEVLFYKFVEFIFETLQAIIHFVVAIKFWRKGESVPPVNNPLLLKSATKLAAEIRAGELRSEVVVRAYINRIRTVDPYVNATVNRCFEQALREALEADSLIASGRYTKEQLAKEKPLLGVPLTVKTFLRVKGECNIWLS
ncbi:fatty-acid amide hydrolase 2-A [Nephila pilipes]|uniref:Fatty-acid amide hydrolase 2-A n=1 Tax=Nephila pilipes TaxID=299642 RepID=A0A8X6PUT9_NEPPI|nr:fatty-acid amide hydrolase 2-A [Nephila pilipes]